MDKRMRKKKVIIIIGCMFFALLWGCDTQKNNSNNIATGASQNTGEPTDAAGEVKSEQNMNADGDTLSDHTKKAEPAERQPDADTAGEYVTTDENGETIILQPQSPTNLSESKQEETVNAEKNVNIKKPEESENAQKQEPEQSEKTEETEKEDQKPSNTDGEKKSEELELPFVPRGK